MAATPDYVIPLHSLEAEMGVLGSMLLSRQAIDQVLTILKPSDFYRPGHQVLFEAMVQLSRVGRPIDFVTLKEELQVRGTFADVGGIDYLEQIAEYVPSPSSVDAYADIVLEKSILRSLEVAGRDIVGMGRDSKYESSRECLEAAEQKIFEIGNRGLGAEMQEVGDLAETFMNELDAIMDLTGPLTGVPSGFSDLDKLTTGFYPSDFIIVGARPAMGKTSLMLNFAIHVASQLIRVGKRGSVAVFSLEMSADAIVRRMVSMISAVEGQKVRAGNLSQAEFARLANGCAALQGLPIYVDESSGLSPLEIRAKCRRLEAKHGLSLVIIDYLQLMRSSRKSENRVQEISEIARSVKALAKDLKVPVIVGSQLSRLVEQRPDRRPQLSDLRESGSIEAEADLAMLLYRDSYYKAKEEHRQEISNPDEAHEAEIIVAKHRNGPTGKVTLGFQPAYARFVLWSSSDPFAGNA